MKTHYKLLFFLLFATNCMFGQSLVPFKHHTGLWGFKDAAYRRTVIKPNYHFVNEFTEGLAGVSKVTPTNELRFGFINEIGNEVIPLKYLNIDQFSEGLAAFKASNNKVGYIDKTGKEVIEAKYDFANKFCNGLAAVMVNKKSGYIDKTGKVVIPLIYEMAQDFKADYAVAKINGTLVQLDKTGKELPMISENGYVDRSTESVIINASNYRHGYGFTADGLAIIQSQNYLYGAINKNGNTVIPFKYNSINRLENGLYEVSSNSRFGIVDKYGTEKIAPRFDMIADFTPEIAVAKLGEQWVIIDNRGNITTPLLSDFYFFERKSARVRVEKKWGVINQQGTLIMPIEYQSISLRSGGLIAFQKNDKWGLANPKGEIYLEPKYDEINHYFDGLAVVKKDKLYGFINNTGKEIVAPKYSRVEDFSYGLSKIEIEGLFGFINESGKEIIPPAYTKANNFSEGFAMVAKNQKYGFIDISGKPVIPLKYNDASDFSEGLASVGQFGQYGFIDKFGKMILPVKYDETKPFVNGLAPIKVEEKWGFINKSGTVVIEPIYERVQHFSEKKAAVRLTKKWGYINENGKEIINPKYGQAEIFSEGLAAVNYTDLGGKWGFVDTLGKEIGYFQYRAVGNFENNKASVLDWNWKEYFIGRDGKEIKPLKNKQAAGVFVVFKKASDGNNGQSGSNNTVNEKNKKLNESFSLVFNYKKNSSGVFESNFSPRKFEVSKDYITEYISSNGYFTQWGGVKVIAESDTKTEDGEVLNLYKCTDGILYGFFKGKTNYMLSIIRKNGEKEFYFTSLD